ncbi:helix-turn-helix transcriptional regulator [Dehalococcoides sp.]|jgi:transcriptional regulator with XRE-family HTH domain|uniref:helix-turn-helix transcriptional regulator n=1 Tax=Dehalococcoides sp. TaxID=1966486 RepID=UPI0035637B87
MVKVKLNRLALEVAMSRKNLSQRDLAEKLGFSRSHLSHIINGRREPSPVLRRLILDYLPEYTFDDLFIIEENGGNVRAND